MMITSLWYVAYRAPTGLCEVLLRCQVCSTCFWYVLVSSADLWKQQFHGSFGQGPSSLDLLILLSFENFWYWGSQDKWDWYLM